MRLTSFEVQGFKNLTAPIKLEGLEPINVVHGPNNVGKSNLLRAIEVLFRLLPVLQNGARGNWTGLRPPNVLNVGEIVLRQAGIELRDLFNYAVPKLIELSASFSLAQSDQLPESIETGGRIDCVSLRVVIERQGRAVNIRVPSFVFDNVSYFAGNEGTSRAQRYLRLAESMGASLLGSRNMPRIDVYRSQLDAVDALYDACTSDDRKRAMQWTRFTEVMANFSDILGEGNFVVVLPRESKNARLLYETPTMRVPLDALGSGVQQLVALFGHLLTAGAAVTMIEEPELNLRWSLQERVRDVLRDLVGKEGAPSQLFITSHAGTFEAGKEFFWMMPGEQGPTVERRPVSQLPKVVGGPLRDDPENPPRAPTRVTSEGVLRLPDRIRNTVGVERGGNVSFVDKGQGVVEMMSDDTFLKLAGLDDEEDAASE